MPQRLRRMLAIALWLALCAPGIVGCSHTPVGSVLLAPPTLEAARPAVSPQTIRTPAGTVHPLTVAASAAVFDVATGQLAVLGGGGDEAVSTLTVLSRHAAAASRSIPLPAPASALAGDGQGAVYLATRGGYFVVDLARQRVVRVGVLAEADTDFTAIAVRGDQSVLIGTADGAVLTLAAGSPLEARIETRSHVFARVDAIVVDGGDRNAIAAVLDRGQTSVTTIGRDGKPRYALRAGEGATMLAADPRGMVLASDTRGGQLLVYGVDPLILRQAYPVPDAPYGVAGSRHLVWVSQTATNTVIGYELNTGIPVEKVRYPTVRQPDTLTFDDATGTLYVVSGTGAGIQVIEHADGS